MPDPKAPATTPAAPGSPTQPPAHATGPAAPPVTATEATPQSEPPAFATPTAANPGDRGWRPPLVPVTPAPIPSHWQHRRKDQP